MPEVSVNQAYMLQRQLFLNAVYFFMQDVIKSSGDSETVSGCLLGGHLLITRELLSFLSVTKKHQVGCHPTGPNLVRVRGECNIPSQC